MASCRGGAGLAKLKPETGGGGDGVGVDEDFSGISRLHETLTRHYKGLSA